MHNLNNAPQILLDKYYELDSIKGELPQTAVQDIISVLQQTYGLGSVNYKEDRFETKLLNGKVLPQVHIVMKSSSTVLLQGNSIYDNVQRAPQVDYNDNIIYCNTAQQSTAGTLRKIQSGEGLDPLLWLYIKDLGEEKIFILNVYDNGETELIINKDKIYKEE